MPSPNPSPAMPLCGGGKTVHRKLVLLYGLTILHYCQLTNGDIEQRRRCLRQDFTPQRVYHRVSLIFQIPRSLSDVPCAIAATFLQYMSPQSSKTMSMISSSIMSTSSYPSGIPPAKKNSTACAPFLMTIPTLSCSASASILKTRSRTSSRNGWARLQRIARV